MPASFVLGAFIGLMGGPSGPGIVCAYIPALVFFILGLISLIKGMEKSPTTKVETIKNDRICPICGRSIPFDANICPYCGKDFRIKN